MNKPSARVDASGVTRAMYNTEFSKAGVSNTQVAKEFLQENKQEFSIADPGSELKLDKIEQIPGGSHISFTQQYRGIPVHNGGVVISLNNRNEVGMAVNNFKSNIEPVNASLRIDASVAIAYVRTSLPAGFKVIGKPESAKAIIWQNDKGLSYFAYRVRMTTENPSGDWEAFVDASTGSILHIENRFANHNPYVQGTGFVYVTDPLSAAKQRYGTTGFVDNNDADSDSLTFYRTQVTLDSLTFEDGVYKLKGPYCEVTDIENPNNLQVFAIDRNGFNFTRSQQEFEAVNVYYHISKSYQYFQSLGFSSATLKEIKLDPHGFQGADNSHYSPNGNWIAWGDGNVDDAEDIDEILHEYGHAIVYNICPSWGGGESGALGEGFSDYWAVSNSRPLKGWSPSAYEYNWVFNWNSHNVFQLGRVVNDVRTYPFGNLEIHDAGQIWSSALISIWNDLGKETTDKLVLKSLYYLGAAATAHDAAEAIMQADRDLFGGAHIATLAYWLGTVKHFMNPTDYVPTISHTNLPDISVANWPPVVSARISQNVTVDDAWFEFRINSGNFQSVHLDYTGSDMYVGSFPTTQVELSPGDTISYRIMARYGNGNVASNPVIQFYKFRLLNSSATSVNANDSKSLSFLLGQNYPNPCNPSTNITYTIPEPAQVTLRIFTMLGQSVATIVSEEKNSGTFTAYWNGMNAGGASVASGTYVYSLETRDQYGKISIKQRKLTLIK